jgi:hypothetical protein
MGGKMESRQAELAEKLQVKDIAGSTRRLQDDDIAGLTGKTIGQRYCRTDGEMVHGQGYRRTCEQTVYRPKISEKQCTVELLYKPKIP